MKNETLLLPFRQQKTKIVSKLWLRTCGVRMGESKGRWGQGVHPGQSQVAIGFQRNAGTDPPLEQQVKMLLKEVCTTLWEIR